MVWLLFEQAATPNMLDVVEAISSRHPGVPVSIPDNTDRAKAASSPLILCGGEIVVVMGPMPAQLPHDSGIVNLASKTWPDAATAFRRHRSHVIVSVMGPAQDPLKAARAMTAVVGGLIAAVPGCLGALWGRVAHSADRWLQMSQVAFAPDFPCLLWIGLHPFQENGMVGAVTYGLSSFVGREIEHEPNGRDLGSVLRRVANFAAYLINRGAVIGHGETIGASAEERIGVLHATSSRFQNLPVLLVTSSV